LQLVYSFFSPLPFGYFDTYVFTNLAPFYTKILKQKSPIKKSDFLFLI